MEKNAKKTFHPGEFIRNQLMLIVLIVVIIVFAFIANNFFTAGNLLNVLMQSTYAIIIGMGVSMIMISGAIDLSIGYQVSFMAVVYAVLTQDLGQSSFLGIVVIILLGMLLGFLNGFLMVKFNVNALIITLGTSYAYQGLSFILSKSRTFINLPASVTFLGKAYIGGVIPLAIVIMVIAVIVMAFIMNRTYFGRYIYGVGGNEEAIKLAGVNVHKMRLLIYTLSGVFVALGGLVLIGRTGSIYAGMGSGLEFTCMTAGILGGISFRGGEGKVTGMVLGILLLQVLSNGMQLMLLGTYPQYVVKGIVLVAAVAFDSMQKKAKLKAEKLTPSQRLAQAEKQK